MPIIQNAVKITDGKKITYLISRHRYDFVTYTFKNGDSYSLDGGADYRRVCGNIQPDNIKNITYYHLDINSSFDDIVNKLLWGTRAKNGDKPLKYKPLIELTISHLRAILDTQPQIRGTIYEKVIEFILKNRKR